MRNRNPAVAVALALGLAACGGAPDKEQESAAATAAPPAPQATPDPDAGSAASEAESAPEPGFDIANVPLSEIALGEFPYLRLPAGYVYQGEEASDFERIPFWTGDRMEWVEGRLFGGRIIGDKAQGKTFSLLEYQRNMQAAIRQAGGQSIAQGRIPEEFREAVEDADPELQSRLYSSMGNTFSGPVETFVIRRHDRDIWIQVGGYSNGGNLRVVETTPLEITAGLLEASELKRQIDADGRVAIQVNFAVDKADILSDSQPQIDQVLALLREDPALRLSIDGHTDATGDAAHNQRLSEARAQSVVAALVVQSIDASRLEATGHGQSQPVADNDTDEGRAKNRRVELVRLD
ncbi:hypothetical protein GCM10007164_26670 [Luteimonas padinae]|uniref:OmpA family protein n=1 Tax=Luteimonas padinae TaxID=1714359 RepID=A0ABV6SX61_9GAMM|nr:OmpA family protein [Luteimonas padinae]GHD75125.1 hypothetical protein GCM10007164_26670 [Luteimonas padinae]